MNNFFSATLFKTMSLLIPAVAASALWVAGAVGVQWRKEAEAKVEEPDGTEVAPPFWGPTGHISSRLFADTRGRFTRVREDVDHLGARIFLVDYGNGQEVIQYVDPRILL